MKTAKFTPSRLGLLVGLALAVGAAQAAGPLYLSEEAGELKPLRWDTSRGPIPVYTDGGAAFTFDHDGVTPFLTIDRANEITAHAFNQWSSVPTSTFKAGIAGTIAARTGVADVTGVNAADFYGVENGYGFWVLYDTDGSILEDYFGVAKSSVLGIAFPEFSDGQGNIIEATAVMNGWNVYDTDVRGDSVAGVFTHEFGHAINLSHSQVNGQLAYMSLATSPRYPGVAGCGVAPVHRWDHPLTAGVNRANPAIIETMFPFIDHRGAAGANQSTVEHPDDVAGISNLYPTAAYKATRGAITGVLRLKDGRHEYSGLNVIARNVSNPLRDAVSDMSGSATQGELGPDGRFTINNLTPGQQYVVYIEAITAGGYPTTPQRLVSQAEYWNVAENSDPLADDKCDATPILAEAGVTKQADITFNGYMDGVQYTPVVSASLTEVSKSGQRVAGVASGVGFTWDRNKGIELLPAGFSASHGAMDRTGQRQLVLADLDGNGIRQPVIYGNNQVVPLGDLNGNTCGGASVAGVSAASGWAMDDAGSKAVGLAYIDRDGDGICQKAFANEIVPFVWDAKGGMRELPVERTTLRQWTRATGISGNGRLIMGSDGLVDALAWIDEGTAINLGKLVGANDLYASNHDGTRVPMYSSKHKAMLMWNAMRGTGEDAFTNIGGLRYCHEVPLIQGSRDLCRQFGADFIFQQLGYAPLTVSTVNDKGDVALGRAGSSGSGYAGGIWIEGLGWMRTTEFLRKQGVVEAEDTPFDNPVGMSASGSEIVGGIPGISFSWIINADQVYVCENGKSVLTGFPNGLRDKVAAGAKFGRCEFLN